MMLLFSCKEDLKTNRELLTTPSWEFSTVTGNDTFGVALIQAFFTGATQNFLEDGTYIIDFATGSTIDADTGTWELGADNVSLTFDKGTVDESLVSIDEITEKILTFTETDSSSSVTLSFTAVE